MEEVYRDRIYKMYIFYLLFGFLQCYFYLLQVIEWQHFIIVTPQQFPTRPKTRRCIKCLSILSSGPNVRMMIVVLVLCLMKPRVKTSGAMARNVMSTCFILLISFNGGAFGVSGTALYIVHVG